MIGPDFSVLFDQRLVAYLWRKNPGRIYRGQSQATLADSSFVEAQLFDLDHTELILRLARDAGDFDTLLFRIGLEGLTVQPGKVAPAPHQRRF